MNIGIYSVCVSRGEGKEEVTILLLSPAVLNEEQRQNLSMFIDPVTKFFAVRAYTRASLLPDQQPFRKSSRLGAQLHSADEYSGITL